MSKKYINKLRSCICNINYHIFFVCKWRRKFLKPRTSIRCKEFLLDKAVSLGIEIVSMESDLDHIHTFVRCRPDVILSEIVRQLKGYSSYKLRKLFPYLTKHKYFWSDGYFAESIGSISEKVILKYIANQGSKSEFHTKVILW